jgi:hypothetical protein
VPVDDIREPVSPDWVIPLEVSPVHMPEFVTSDSWIFHPDFLDVLQGESLSGRTGQNL